MRRFEKTLASGSLSRPGPVEPRQPLLIEPDGARVIGHRANKPPVQDSQNHEGCDRNQKQKIDPAEMPQPEQDPGHTKRSQPKLGIAGKPLPGLERERCAEVARARYSARGAPSVSSPLSVTVSR